MSSLPSKPFNLAGFQKHKAVKVTDRHCRTRKWNYFAEAAQEFAATHVAVAAAPLLDLFQLHLAHVACDNLIRISTCDVKSSISGYIWFLIFLPFCLFGLFSCAVITWCVYVRMCIRTGCLAKAEMCFCLPFHLANVVRWTGGLTF